MFMRMSKVTGVYALWRTSVGVGTMEEGKKWHDTWEYDWVCIQREGDLFSAFHLVDGIMWEEIAMATTPMPNTVEVGVVLASGNYWESTLAKVDIRNVAITPLQATST